MAVNWFVVVNWFINGEVSPMRVDGAGATYERETSLLLLMEDGLKVSYKCLAMEDLGHLVIG